MCHPDGEPTYLDDDKHFFIRIYRTLHDEVCYGRLKRIDFIHFEYGSQLNPEPVTRVTGVIYKCYSYKSASAGRYLRPCTSILRLEVTQQRLPNLDFCSNQERVDTFIMWVTAVSVGEQNILLLR